MHAAWNIASEKDIFLASILKSKYYPNTSFWLAKHNTIKSPFWSSILQIKDTLTQNCIVQIHKGNSSIWSTPWCEIWNNIHDHLKLPTSITPLPQTIQDLKSNNTQSWNYDLISQIFSNEATQVICSTQIVPSDQVDIIRWKQSKKGICTSKEAFRYLNSSLQEDIPQQGSRSISHQALYILRRVWFHKQIPPCIKTFTWRLIRRALATAIRAAKLTDKISKECSLRHVDENDAHLFFHCPFARAVWFSGNYPICSSVLPIEQDGVQDALSKLIN